MYASWVRRVFGAPLAVNKELRIWAPYHRLARRFTLEWLPFRAPLIQAPESLLHFSAVMFNPAANGNL